MTRPLRTGRQRRHPADKKADWSIRSVASADAGKEKLKDGRQAGLR
jgi:hypothetical protein